MATKQTPSQRKPRAKRSAARADKSVEAFRDALERSVTLSRERIEEIVDDAVERGRMTRKDANELVSKMIDRSRKQTEDLVKELERLMTQVRKEIDSRTGGARRRAERAAERATRTARDVADEPLAQADRLRRRAGVGRDFPITAYDELTVAQIKSRLGDLTKPELRKVRTYEQKNKARKGVLAEIEKKLK